MKLTFINCLLPPIHRKERSQSRSNSIVQKIITEAKETIAELKALQSNSVLIGSREEQLQFLKVKLEYDGSLLSREVQ